MLKNPILRIEKEEIKKLYKCKEFDRIIRIFEKTTHFHKLKKDLNCSCELTMTKLYKGMSNKQQQKLIDLCNYNNKREKKWHILTDIDDTLFTTRLGGTDISQTPKIPYEGVRTLIESITKENTQYYTMITGRPDSRMTREYIKNIKFIKTPKSYLACNSFKNIMMPAIYSTAKIRSSFLRKINLWEENSKLDEKYKRSDISLKLEEIAHKETGKNKIKSIDIFQSLFPEYKILFIGDPGQADVEVALHILSKYPDSFAIIHDIKRIQYYKNKKYTIDSVFKERYPHLIQNVPDRMIISNDYREILKKLKNFNNLFF